MRCSMAACVSPLLIPVIAAMKQSSPSEATTRPPGARKYVESHDE